MKTKLTDVKDKLLTFSELQINAYETYSLCSLLAKSSNDKDKDEIENIKNEVNDCICNLRYINYYLNSILKENSEDELIYQKIYDSQS